MNNTAFSNNFSAVIPVSMIKPETTANLKQIQEFIAKEYSPNLADSVTAVKLMYVWTDKNDVQQCKFKYLTLQDLINYSKTFYSTYQIEVNLVDLINSIINITEPPCPSKYSSSAFVLPYVTNNNVHQMISISEDLYVTKNTENYFVALQHEDEDGETDLIIADYAAKVTFTPVNCFTFSRKPSLMLKNSMSLKIMQSEGFALYARTIYDMLDNELLVSGSRITKEGKIVFNDRKELINYITYLVYSDVSEMFKQNNVNISVIVYPYVENSIETEN